VYDKQHRLILRSPSTKNQNFKVEIDVVDYKYSVVVINERSNFGIIILGILIFEICRTWRPSTWYKVYLIFAPLKEVCKECMETRESRNSFQQYISSEIKKKL